MKESGISFYNSIKKAVKEFPHGLLDKKLEN